MQEQNDKSPMLISELDNLPIFQKLEKMLDDIDEEIQQRNRNNPDIGHPLPLTESPLYADLFLKECIITAAAMVVLLPEFGYTVFRTFLERAKQPTHNS